MSGSAPSNSSKLRRAAAAERRGGPGTGYNVHGTLGYGAKIVVACWETGTSITSTWPDGESYSTNVWDALIDSTNLPTGMYVSDAWINTGGDTSTMVPACSDLPANPSGYPWPSVSETGTDPRDGYGYHQGQCTSFAAWEIRSDRLPHTKSPDGMGNAYSWTGLTSTSTPHVGEVAQWDPNVHGAGNNGHVAYVVAVYPDTNTILVYEYNWTDAFDNNQYLRLSERTVYLNHTDYTGPPSRYLKF